MVTWKNLWNSDFAILALLIILFYVAILGMRLLGIYKKRKCPSCSGKLIRKHKTLSDLLLIKITLNILPFRRYKCRHCGWEGSRWNTRKDRKKETPTP